MPTRWVLHSIREVPLDVAAFDNLMAFENPMVVSGQAKCWNNIDVNSTPAACTFFASAPLADQTLIGAVLQEHGRHAAQLGTFSDASRPCVLNELAVVDCLSTAVTVRLKTLMDALASR